MMNRTSKIVLTTSAMFLALFVGRPETAQAITSTVTVQATVVKACTISNATLDFGQYNPTSTTDTTGTGTLGFKCSNGVPITIDLGNGAHTASGMRGMANGANILPYQIYSGSASGPVWGTGLAGGTNLSTTGTGLDATVTMYGKIPQGTTSVIEGTYLDTVVATLNF
jgi:spore coat protein U-like protein